jgi:hypothetical protein
MIDISKYKFYDNGRDVVVAVSSFAGDKVRGIAKLNPNDSFNLERGKEIAAARCDEKISMKRLKRGYRKIEETKAALERAQMEYERAIKYTAHAEANYNRAVFELENLMTCV